MSQEIAVMSEIRAKRKGLFRRLFSGFIGTRQETVISELALPIAPSGVLTWSICRDNNGKPGDVLATGQFEAARSGLTHINVDPPVTFPDHVRLWLKVSKKL